MLVKMGSGGNVEPVKELVEQFPLLSVLPFGDREEDVFEDLAIVPLILIRSVMLAPSHSKAEREFTPVPLKILVRNIEKY